MTIKRTFRTEHPLYIIPSEYQSVQKAFQDLDMMEVSDVMPNGDLHVYASEFSPDTCFTVSFDYGNYGSNEEVLLSEFAPKYTPTSEEVMRALQGPMGPTGPMGPKGDRGESRKCECLELEDEVAQEPPAARYPYTKEQTYGLPPVDLSEGGKAKGSER